MMTKTRPERIRKVGREEKARRRPSVKNTSSKSAVGSKLSLVTVVVPDLCCRLTHPRKAAKPNAASISNGTTYRKRHHSL